MKILINWIIASAMLMLLCLNATAQSQDYYWSDNQKFYLERDYTAVLIHLNETASAVTLANRLGTTDNKIKSIEIHEAKNSLLVHLKDGMERNQNQWRNEIGLNEEDIRSISPALRLDDGFPLWNTHKVVLKLKRGHSLSQLDPFLSKYNAWIREEQFGNILLETDQINNILPLANAIRESGLVEFSHPDFYAVITKLSDPLYPFQFQMNNTGQSIDGYSGQPD